MFRNSSGKRRVMKFFVEHSHMVKIFVFVFSANSFTRKVSSTVSMVCAVWKDLIEGPLD